MVLALLLGGCKSGALVDTADTSVSIAPPSNSMIEVSSWTVNTNGGGALDVEIEIGPDVTAFMLTGTSRKDVGIEGVVDPDGKVLLHWQDWWTSDESLTEAIWGYDNTTALNWPIRDVDDPLREGTYVVQVAALSNGDYTSGKVNLTLHTKQDPSLTSGTVYARIVYTGSVDQEPGVVRATEDAVERWREVWAAYGIELIESYDTAETIDSDLGFWYAGDDAMIDIAAGLETGSVVVYMGEQVSGDFETLGVAGGIPGTLSPTPMTYVVVSWLSHAGFDAQFTKAEKSIMGETMAHEVGHYMGLFHPVEENYSEWDALADTPRCDTWSTCEDQLGDNLMFPYSVCSGNDCVPAGILSTNQQGVVHRYTGTQ
jgi:hypothetical protein